MEFEFAGRMLAALAVIAVVLFAVQFVARAGLRQRLSTRGGSRLMTVVETTSLPNASSLHAVKVGERYIVVGRSGNYIAMLCELPPQTVEDWLAAQPASPLRPSALADMIARLRGSRPQIVTGANVAPNRAGTATHDEYTHAPSTHVCSTRAAANDPSPGASRSRTTKSAS